jgi:hypothetical protein
LTKTTTNTVVVTGDANGLTAKDLAIVTVVVADVAPGLPTSGITPDKESSPIVPIVLMGVFAAWIVNRRKQTI